MSEPTTTQLLQIAEATVRKAMALALDPGISLDVRTKTNRNDLVTAVDRRIEEVVAARLAEATSLSLAWALRVTSAAIASMRSTFCRTVPSLSWKVTVESPWTSSSRGRLRSSSQKNLASSRRALTTRSFPPMTVASQLGPAFETITNSRVSLWSLSYTGK